MAGFRIIGVLLYVHFKFKTVTQYYTLKCSKISILQTGFILCNIVGCISKYKIHINEYNKQVLTKKSISRSVIVK